MSHLDHAAVPPLNIECDAQLSLALTRFCSAITTRFGKNIKRAVLFGSCARDMMHPGTDCDIAIFFKKNPPDLNKIWQEKTALTEIILDIHDDTGVFIHLLPLHHIKPSRRNSFLMKALKKEGIDLL